MQTDDWATWLGENDASLSDGKALKTFEDDGTDTGATVEISKAWQIKKGATGLALGATSNLLLARWG